MIRINPNEYFNTTVEKKDANVINTSSGQIIVVKQPYIPVYVWVILGIAVAGCVVLAYASIRKKY